MNIADIWPRHRIPIVVTGVGLLIAFILAVAPTINFTRPPPQPATKVASAAASTQEIEALSGQFAQLLANTNNRLSSIETRLHTLEEATVRNFERIRATQDQVSAIDGVPQTVRKLDAIVANLDRAVPRLDRRLRDAVASPNMDPALATSVRAMEARVATLDKAVVRLFERQRGQLANGSSETEGIVEKIDAMSQALNDLASSLQAKQ